MGYEVTRYTSKNYKLHLCSQWGQKKLFDRNSFVIIKMWEEIIITHISLKIEVIHLINLQTRTELIEMAEKAGTLPLCFNSLRLIDPYKYQVTKMPYVTVMNWWWAGDKPLITWTYANLFFIGIGTNLGTNFSEIYIKI